jgi:hypothetical protein
MTNLDQRPLSAVLGDILRDIQQIFRGEVQLARAEALQELSKLKTGAVLLSISAVMGALGLAYLLLASIYLIATQLPLWASALIVAGAALAIAGLFASAGVSAFRRIHGTPRTVRSLKELKETVRWTT